MDSPASEPDLCIIGAGGAGFEAAMAGAALGLRVVVIDRDGGDPSLRNGDLALEVFRAAARRAGSGPFGPAPVDFATVRTHLLAALQAAAPDRRLARLETMNVHVIRDTARFADARTILAGGRRLRPRRIIIATGSVARQSGVAGLPQLPVIAPDRLDNVLDCPRHLLIAGSDAAALALGQSFCRLGAAVTVLTSGDLLPDWDPELAGPVLHRLRMEGLVVLPPDAAAQPVSGNRGPSFSSHDERISAASHLLLAGGRRPAIDDLHVERAGIAMRGGALLLSAALRTSNPRVYAIGEVTGADSLAAATAQLGTVLRAAFFRMPVRYRPGLVPRIVHTDPAIATVGLTQAEADLRGPVSIHRWPFAETDAGRASGDTGGHVKIVADRRGRVLGAGIVGAEARELIGFWTLAIGRGATLGQLAGIPMSRLSFGDASRRAVMAHVARRLGKPWIKRALALVARLG